MFIETYKDNDIILTFLKSVNVQAFPCGRRRSALINADANSDGNIGADEGYYIPFDPEAKLNTEANNRKHSSLNGYTQTYVKGLTDDTLSIVLAGYLFNLKAGNTYSAIGNSIVDALRDFYVADNISDSYDSEDAKQAAETELRDTFNTATNKIYANIRLEDLQLFTGFHEYMTSVLRDQTGDGIPSVYLDICDVNKDSSNFNNYYFSGLSFSTTPLTSIAAGYTSAKTREQLPHTVTRSGININQQLVSLCILEKVDEEWRLYQPALLPEIRHDDTPNSLVLGDTRIEKIEGINPGNLTVENDLTVEHNATIENDATIYNKLTVGNDTNQYVIIDSKAVEGTSVVEVKGNTKLEGTLTATGAVTLQNTLEVTGKVTANDDLEVKKTITATENLGDSVNAKFKKAEVEVLTATNALYQNNDSNITKPVPILDVVETDDGSWQLQFSRVSIIPKS